MISAMSQTTTMPTPAQAAQRARHLVDASGQVLGRMATRVATLLRGKHKPFYAGSVDCGDFVVVTNAAQVRLTGRKAEQKHYFRHSGYASGAKVIPFKRQFESNPCRVIELAVKRMIPVNRLRSRQMARLKVHRGSAPAALSPARS